MNLCKRQRELNKFNGTGSREYCGTKRFTASNGGQRELSTEHKERDNNQEIQKTKTKT